MKKILLLLTGLIISVTALSTAAYAKDPIIEDFGSFTSSIIIIDTETVTELKTTQSMTVKSFLESKDIDVKNYRNHDNSVIPDDDYMEKNEVHRIYKLSPEGTSKIIDLPIPVIERKTPALIKGESRVVSEGSKGKALQVKIEDIVAKDDAKTFTTSISVLEKPEAKIIEYGTGKTISEYLAEQRVNPNRSHRVSQAELDEILAASPDSDLVKLLVAQVGKNYVWGAQGPNSFDCSGLTYYVLKNTTHPGLSRVTAANFGYQSKSIKVDDLKPGDILWTSTHIGVYAGSGKMIHAANTSVGVVIDDLNWFLNTGARPGRL